MMYTKKLFSKWKNICTSISFKCIYSENPTIQKLLRTIVKVLGEKFFNQGKKDKNSRSVSQKYKLNRTGDNLEYKIKLYSR